MIMNMSSAQFQNLTNQFPSEAHAIRRLESLFVGNKKTRIPLNGLYELTSPSSNYALLKILMELEKAGCIAKLYQVVSPMNGEGIQEYTTFMDIPSEIADWRSQNEVIPVTPTIVQVIYKSP